MDSMKNTIEKSLRVHSCEQGCLSQADGSALYVQGDTVVLATVIGPTEVKSQKFMIDRATVEVVYNPRVGISAIGDKLKTQLIRNSCETVLLATLHPRTSIVVSLQEMQDFGGVSSHLKILETSNQLLSCCINAMCMALLDAGLSMRFLIAAVTCGITHNGEIIVDPTDKQLKDCNCSLTLAFDSQNFEVLACWTEGWYLPQQAMNCMEAARQASKQIFGFYRNAIKRRFIKEQ